MLSDTVEIQDPPLEAIDKKHSCVRRSCVTGCGCFLFLILGAAALVVWSAKPNIRIFKTPPAIVPTDLPLYDRDSIDSITYTAGQPSRPLVDGAVIGAKIIVSPLVYLWERYAPPSNTGGEENSPDSIGQLPIKDALYQYITRTPAPVTDTVVIDWVVLPASATFISSYYATELKKHAYVITEQNGSDDDQAIFFTKDHMRGVLEIKNNPATPGTDLIRLTLTFRAT